MPALGEFGRPWWCCVCQTLVFEGEPGMVWLRGPQIHLNPLFQCFVACLGPSDGCRGVSLQSLWPFVACSQSSPRTEPGPAQTWEPCPQCW